MRAEAQAHVDTINEALALLRRFLDWDRALRRLDELNARVEDQDLWSDPKAAQEVMRERRRLDEAITATRAIQSELTDTVELIEMADAEGDAELERDGVAALAEPGETARTSDKMQGAAGGRGRRQRQLYRDQRRRRRHREPGLGGDAPAHVHPLGRAARHTRSSWSIITRASRPGSSRPRCCSRARTPMAIAKTESGVHRLVRISPYDSARRGATPASRAVWVYPVIDDDIQVDYQRKRPAHRYLSRVGGRAGSISTPPIRRCASPICRPTSSSSARTSDRSTRTRPRPIISSAPASTSCELAEARGRWPMPRTRPRPTSAGATRSAAYVLQPYQLVKDLRTGVTSTSPSATYSTAGSIRLHGCRACRSA